jgi:hypothetical protein
MKPIIRSDLNAILAVQFREDRIASLMPNGDGWAVLIVEGDKTADKIIEARSYQTLGEALIALAVAINRREAP